MEMSMKFSGIQEQDWRVVQECNRPAERIRKSARALLVHLKATVGDDLDADDASKVIFTEQKGVDVVEVQTPLGAGRMRLEFAQGSIGGHATLDGRYVVERQAGSEEWNPVWAFRVRADGCVSNDDGTGSFDLRSGAGGRATSNGVFTILHSVLYVIGTGQPDPQP
jgi:hypothetical protein